MTASQYTDPRQRAALPVGNLFSEAGQEKSPQNSNHENPLPAGLERSKGVKHTP
jgi:hypothetical protein